MNKTVAFILILCACTSQFSLSQTDGNDGSTFIGINPAHTIILQAVSHAMDPNVSYLPVHILVNHSFTEHIGISGLFLYRLDKDGENFLTHEFGFAIGPAYLSKNLNAKFD